MEQQTEIAEPQEPPSQQVFFPEAEEEPPGRVASFVPSPDATTFPIPNILPFPLHRRQTVTGRDTGRQFRRKFFPDITVKQWNDWHWQVANRVRSLERLQNMFILSPDEREALERSDAKLPMGITPY